MRRATGYLGAGFLLVVLAACDVGPPAEIKLRPGLGQEADLDAIRPPSGRNYRYDVETEGVPLPGELRLRSIRRSATQMEYRGTFNLTLPNTGNLEAIGRDLVRAFDIERLNFEIRGNTLLLPVTMRTDNRYRTLRSSLIAFEGVYDPHDCFAVLGTCRYTTTVGSQTVALLAETSEANGVWRTEIKPDPRARQQGQDRGRVTEYYSIDRNAVPIDIVVVRRFGRDESLTAFRRK